MIFIFDLGLGQRGLVVHAPIDGAQPLVHKVILVEKKKVRSTTDSYCGVIVA